MPDRTDPTIPFDGLQARLLPVADIVMLLMWSKPESGTLRDTHVTIVTIYLAVATAVVGLALAVLGIALGTAGHQPLWLAGAIVLLLLAAGCADLALFAIRQRLLVRAASA